MKTAEEYYDLFEEYDTELLYLDAFKKVINEARKEAIEECAERARVTNPYQDGRKSYLRGKNLENYIENNPAKIDKESILSLIKELT